MLILNEISFFECFEADILSEKKTITIRDERECDYEAGKQIVATTLEESREFAILEIKSVTPINFSELNQEHAAQENMILDELREILRRIYPNTDELYVIDFKLIKPIPE